MTSFQTEANNPDLIDDPLDQVKFSFQRRVQQQSQRVEFHSHAVIDAFRADLTQVGPLSLRRRAPCRVTQTSFKNLSKRIIETGLAAAADHDEVCPAGVGASALCGAQAKPGRRVWGGRGVACFPALCALLIQFAGTNWKKHIYFSNTAIMQPEAGIRGCEKSTKPAGGGGGNWVMN